MSIVHLDIPSHLSFLKSTPHPFSELGGGRERERSIKERLREERREREVIEDKNGKERGRLWKRGRERVRDSDDVLGGFLSAPWRDTLVR